MAWIAPIAAAARQRREEREEQEMIERLRREDPSDRYEYKVLRSHAFAFGNPGRLSQALNQEARAGWEMVSKLDSSRLMLRRQRSMRAADAVLPPEIDPYRVMVDGNVPLIVVMVGLGVLALALLGTLIGFRGGSTLVAGEILVIILVLALLVGLVLALAVKRR